MLGEDILVAPVVTKGARERAVYFPRGRWQDEDGTIYAGDGRKKIIPAPLGKLPWFRRV